MRSERRVGLRMEAGEHRMTITSVRSDIQTGERASSKKFVGYMPDVINFLRRCDDGR
ncbi:MAG: hypothetical protein ACE5OW_02170 [Candidatus Bathyarchaeia archaeon]